MKKETEKNRKKKKKIERRRKETEEERNERNNGLFNIYRFKREQIKIFCNALEHLSKNKLKQELYDLTNRTFGANTIPVRPAFVFDGNHILKLHRRHLILTVNSHRLQKFNFTTSVKFIINRRVRARENIL